MSVVKFKRQQSADEILAKKQTKEILHEWVDDATIANDDIEDVEDYRSMLVYSFLNFAKLEMTDKVVRRAIKVFVKTKWVVVDKAPRLP